MRIQKLIASAALSLTAAIHAHAQQPDTKVTLGIKPDYWYTASGTGVKVKDVVHGETAEATGIKADDIITALNGKTIKDIFAYKNALDTYKPGDSVIVAVLRDKKPMVFRTRFPEKAK